MQAPPKPIKGKYLKLGRSFVTGLILSEFDRIWEETGIQPWLGFDYFAEEFNVRFDSYMDAIRSLLDRKLLIIDTEPKNATDAIVLYTIDRQLLHQKLQEVK